MAVVFESYYRTPVEENKRDLELSVTPKSRFVPRRKPSS